jgi:lipoyl(octanoyl) transferase
MNVVEDIVVKRLGRTAYGDTLQAMRAFTRGRDAGTADEIWLTEHAPVYTLGQGADEKTVPNRIPVIRAIAAATSRITGPTVVL